jgi:hypothetical protein
MAKKTECCGGHASECDCKKSPGAKHDAGKVPIHSVLAYFPRALEQVARVSEHGAKLHGWNTWDTIDDPLTRYANADLRHELAICKGEQTDPESNLLHLAHKAWNALARLELTLKGEGK